MKSIQTLLMVSVCGCSAFASTVAVNFDDGAEWNSHVTGNVQLNGSDSDQAITVGSAARAIGGDVELTQGIMNYSHHGLIATVGKHLILDDGTRLNASADTDPLRLNGAVDIHADSAIALDAVNGAGSMTLSGAAITAKDMAANTGGITNTDSSQAFHLVAASNLPAAHNTFTGDVDIDVAPSQVNDGAGHMVDRSYDTDAGKTVSVQTFNVGISEVKAAYFKGTVKAHTLNLGANAWDVPVITQ